MPTQKRTRTPTGKRPGGAGGPTPGASRGRKAPTSSPDISDRLEHVEAALVALRAEIAAMIGSAGPELVPASSSDRAIAQLQRSTETLGAALADVPKAQDFQPLADHLYTFAESAPRLIESLESIRSAVEPLEATARTIEDVAETLAATHQTWSESLLRLPRAEDYEPLAAPLREFARVSPVLSETLAAVVRAVTPLPDLIRQLSESSSTARSRETSGPSPATEVLRSALTAVADRLASARTAIRGGLASLPRDAHYARFAAQLRELATVSPSLMDWLSQVPSLSLPLGEAVASLDQAAQDLEEAEEAARRALEPPS
jgi:hypothetical protein